MHAEIATRRQRGRAHSRRVERLAGLLNEYVEAGLAQELLQAIVKHMARGARHLGPCHHELALNFALAPHRHRCRPFRISDLHTESGEPDFVNGLLESRQEVLRRSNDDEARLRRVLAIWHESRDPRGTIVESY